MERLQDPQGLTDCTSAHTLIEVGERQEAIDFCYSILRTPAKTISELQTRAYLTVLIGCIDKRADREVQLHKARVIWHRIKVKHDNAYGVSFEAREISRSNTEQKWKGVMDSLDETEANYKKELEAARIPLENKITVLENDLLVSQGRITLLQDQSIMKQEKIDILQAEVALLKSKQSSEYTQSSIIKHASPASPNYNLPWPLSLCLSAASDPDDSDAVIADNAHNHFQRPSMILDNQTMRYSTAHQTMTNGEPSAGVDLLNIQTLTPVEGQQSDLDRLMMNGPILVRPGKPLAYVDDAGNIIEVDVDISDLPPMMFPHAKPNEAASNASFFAGRHKSTRF